MSKVINKDPATQSDSFAELLGQLTKNSAALVRDEVELVIQRARQKVRVARSGVLLLATGAVISFAAFMSLCAALIIGLTFYMAPAIAALFTAVAFALVGGLIAFMGYKQLKSLSLKNSIQSNN